MTNRSGLVWLRGYLAGGTMKARGHRQGIVRLLRSAICAGHILGCLSHTRNLRTEQTGGCP